MSKSTNYQQAMRLVREGRNEAALVSIQRCLANEPDNAEAFNDAGSILYGLGRFGEAVCSLERARELSDDSSQVCWNLAQAYLADGRAMEASQLFEDMQQMGVLSAEVVRATAGQLADRGDLAGAMETVLKAIEIGCDRGEIEALAESIKDRRVRIAFFCGGDGDTFLRDIYKFVAERFNVRLFEGKTSQDMHKLMSWSDISWFEWCTQLAAIGSQLPKVCRNIIRLHRYEAYLDWPAKVKWDNVDTLITVGNSTVNEVLRRQVGDISKGTNLVAIPNGVNLGKIRLVRRQRGKNIAFVGNMRMVKNPMLLLQCIAKLHSVDPDYKLFWAGKVQDVLVEQYVRHMIGQLGLEGAVFFDGWQRDVGSWLKNKHYIACTSVIESQGMGILEGMANGLKPLIHNFPGAEQIYPRELLFNTPDDFCDLVLSGPYQPANYRKFVEDRYSLEGQLERINRLFRGFEGSRPTHRQQYQQHQQCQQSQQSQSLAAV